MKYQDVYKILSEDWTPSAEILLHLLRRIEDLEGQVHALNYDLDCKKDEIRRLVDDGIALALAIRFVALSAEGRNFLDPTEKVFEFTCIYEKLLAERSVSSFLLDTLIKPNNWPR